MATISDIAKRAGVTTGTVSNILNEKYVPVRPAAVKRADKIRRIAQELDYHPNASARSMRNGRFGSIGLLGSTVHGRSEYADYLWGINDGCHQEDLRLTLGDVSDEMLAETGAMPRILREWSVDGLIVAYAYGFPEELKRGIEAFRVPSIWLNVKLEHDCVYPDDNQGMQLATMHLIELGHRDIMFVGKGVGDHYSVADRIDGYSSAMKDAGLKPVVSHPEAAFLYARDVFVYMKKLFCSSSRPTGVVVAEWHDYPAVHHAAVAAGLSVPDDLSIVTCGNHMAFELGQNMTTVVRDTTGIGRKAVEMLVRKIDGSETMMRAEAVPYQLMEPHGSAAPAAR